MSPKNPFVNCKTRKHRKKRGAVLKKPKPYCPSTMVRYDNSPNEYPTVFVYKMCMTCVLSEHALKSHIIRCKEVFKEPAPVKKIEESPCYICEDCNKVFSRKVILKAHREEQENTTNGLESDESDEEEFVKQ